MNKIDKSNFVIEDNYDESIHSCLICLEPLTFPIKCITCGTLYCKKCAEQWKNSNKKCPKKCTAQEWQLQQSKPLGILLKCPFENQDCKFMSPQQFQIHYKTCEKAPIKLKQKKTQDELKKNYLCNEQHPLQFIGNQNREFVTINCTNCEIQERICRSICYSCKDKKDEIQGFTYCCLCRPPLITRQMCPLKHKFKIRKHNLWSISCDFCSVDVAQIGNYCYNDLICDYALCLNCYNKLPKQKNQYIYQVEVAQENDDDDDYIVD